MSVEDIWVDIHRPTQFIDNEPFSYINETLEEDVKLTELESTYNGSAIEQHIMLIASGYEFECQCGTLNKISSIPNGNLGENGLNGSVVTCKECGADLIVDDYIHCID